MRISGWQNYIFYANYEMIIWPPYRHMYTTSQGLVFHSQEFFILKIESKKKNLLKKKILFQFFLENSF